MMYTIWSLAILSTIVGVKMMLTMFFGESGLSKAGWVIFTVAVVTSSVTVGVLFAGDWPAYVASWSGA